LHQHAEGVLHALAQVCGAAGRQQGAQLEGGGHALLVDVGQQVLVLLAAQDDLGVVVIKVDLWGEREREREGCYVIIMYELLCMNTINVFCNAE